MDFWAIASRRSWLASHAMPRSVLFFARQYLTSASYASSVM
jgi:hypothetical protein